MQRLSFLVASSSVALTGLQGCTSDNPVKPVEPTVNDVGLKLNKPGNLRADNGKNVNTAEEVLKNIEGVWVQTAVENYPDFLTGINVGYVKRKLAEGFSGSLELTFKADGNDLEIIHPKPSLFGGMMSQKIPSMTFEPVEFADGYDGAGYKCWYSAAWIRDEVIFIHLKSENGEVLHTFEKVGEDGMKRSTYGLGYYETDKEDSYVAIVPYTDVTEVDTSKCEVHYERIFKQKKN